MEWKFLFEISCHHATLLNQTQMRWIDNAQLQKPIEPFKQPNIHIVILRNSTDDENQKRNNEERARKRQTTIVEILELLLRRKYVTLFSAILLAD